MKYLIKHKKEFALACGVFAVNAYNLYRALRRGIVDEQTIAAFVFAALTLAGLYYNIPTSKENSEVTPIMREAKRLAKEGDMTLLDAIEHLMGEEKEDGDD